MSSFLPQCLPLLIGSLPFSSHEEASKMIFSSTSQLPLWSQLPTYQQEGMIRQFIPGMPGVAESNGKIFIDTKSENFEQDLLLFYEEYLMITEGGAPLDGSRFKMSSEVAQGFYTLLDKAGEASDELVALKGQTTGPITFCTGLVDHADRAIFYDDQLRDVAIKHLGLKARWQAQKMADLGYKPIMFFDEPGLAGLGTSAFITITKEEIFSALDEVFDGVRSEDGLTGVHVCANTEWSVVFESGVDIVSFDAYSFFNKLILFKQELIAFIERGGVLASGIIPTIPELIEKVSEQELVSKWFEQLEQLAGLGLDRQVVYDQTLITPSCGLGTVSEDQAKKVLKLTKDVSQKIRDTFSAR